MPRSYVHEARRRVGPKRARIVPIVERLAAEYPEATIALRFRNELELLVSVMLSAQTTLLEEFGGRVPHSLEELVRLPGVACKTANVVAAELGDPQGIVVDTHVRRLSQRLGLTKQEDPVKIERDLQRLVPRERWGLFPHLLIWHGRRVCIARAPRCEDCAVNDLCPASRV
ncbi:MAG: endonuclease III [Actinobacteria bacterium]|nr:MAG: endonuclease III [Actinomycetota bacterium]